MKIENRFTNACLWEGSAETLGEAVGKAIGENVNLCGADLCGANLRNADLCGANLRNADLRNADLCGADLRNADLCKANLFKANLCGADLPSNYHTCRMDFGGWSIWIRKGLTSIGCQTHPNENWLKWEPSDVRSFAPGASDWWAKYGSAVKAAITVIETLSSEEE